MMEVAIPHDPRLEQRLFEAYANNRGITLSENDVWMLMFDWNALASRITLTACLEAGVDRNGKDPLDVVTGDAKTWRELVGLLQRKRGDV